MSHSWSGNRSSSRSGWCEAGNLNMEIGVQEDVGLNKLSEFQKSCFSGKIPYECRHERRLPNGCTQDLEQLPVSCVEWARMIIQRRRNHTRFCISAIGGFTFSRHCRRLPFRIYGETRNDCDVDSSTQIPKNGSRNLCFRKCHINASRQRACRKWDQVRGHNTNGWTHGVWVARPVQYFQSDDWPSVFTLENEPKATGGEVFAYSRTADSGHYQRQGNDGYLRDNCKHELPCSLFYIHVHILILQAAFMKQVKHEVDQILNVQGLG